MKKLLLLSFTAVFLCLTIPSFAVNSAPKPVEKEAVQNAAADENIQKAKEAWKALSKKEKRAKRKEMKKALKAAVKAGGDTDTLLLVIIAILLPPLAMAIYDGISNRFWISLLLTILLYVPGLIYTLYIILGNR